MRRSSSSSFHGGVVEGDGVFAIERSSSPMSVDRVGCSANWIVEARRSVGNVDARVVKGLTSSSSLWTVDIAIAARDTT